MLLEILRQLLVDRRLDDALDFARDELRFGLGVERRIRVLYAENAREAFACIFALQATFEVTEEILARSVGVDALGQCRARH